MDNPLDGKSIIIYIPDDFGLPKMFKENMEFFGMNVYLLNHSKTHLETNVIKEVQHILAKVFKKDKKFRLKIQNSKRLQNEKKIHFELLDSIDLKTDFALLIRPDLLNNEVIEKIKSKTEKMIGYQWDGLNRYPEISDKINYFDYFFVFDETDLSFNKKLQLTTNFYFDYDLDIYEVPKKDFYFVGSHIDNRMEFLQKISLFLKEKNFQLDINVMGSSKKYIKNNPHTGINHISAILDFKENYKRIREANVILDLINDVHNGLSFRTFEALGHKKKLITNNAEVKNFEFYEPDNIFILTEENLEGLPEFLSKPYKELPLTIYEKYGFKKWLSNILNISH